jgi:hypothetical protein
MFCAARRADASRGDGTMLPGKNAVAATEHIMAKVSPGTIVQTDEVAAAMR